MGASLYFHKVYFCDAISDHNKLELLKESFQSVIGSSFFHAAISVVIFVNGISN